MVGDGVERPGPAQKRERIPDCNAVHIGKQRVHGCEQTIVHSRFTGKGGQVLILMML